MNRCFTYSRLLRVRRDLELRRTFILGIETSCDDTGAAVIDLQGRLLGESISTQNSTRFGGVIPTIATVLHRDKIEKVVTEALSQANKDVTEMTAVAVTNRPGLKGPLSVGTDYAKYLCKKYHKPMIPVHHMIAHALTVRMEEKVEFPFMILLISGGHSLLGIAKNVKDFDILGSSENDSPGEAFDKIARNLQVHNLPGYRDISGGQAIETLAKKGDPLKINFGIPLRDRRDCMFSFSGFKGNINMFLKREGKEDGHSFPKEGLPDVCASIQYVITKHLCERLQRGIEYCTLHELIKEPGTLVVSGGVASNQFIRRSFTKVCEELGWRAVYPRPKLCTDNGVMIAWTGLELWRQGLDIVQPEDVLKVDTYPRIPMGRDLSESVTKAHIKCKWINILK
eukprot:TRINITY_DN8745_c0_g1_i1.p1 TRINITY_DN8745_c0_g1~~TRINITY_DN8745_c0_g1_i1.p1  ORF type:complete len:397 (-),score=23.86 TRINITY_DN8745_c0_g1_i1:58-1248(-)